MRNSSNTNSDGRDDSAKKISFSKFQGVNWWRMYQTTCGSIVPWSTMTPLTASNSCVSNLADFPFHIHTWTHWNLTKIYCGKKTRIPTQLYLSQWETSKFQNVPWKNTTKGRPQKGLLGIWCVWLFDLILLNGRTPGIWIHHVCSYAWYADKMRVLPIVIDHISGQWQWQWQ